MTLCKRSLLRTLGSLTLALAAPLASAGLQQWDMVELPVDSGAACGNGTPYRFFVNRAAASNNTVIVYEGGGACWDQKACMGQGPLSAANPDGIPPDYMQHLTNMAANGLVTPFSARTDPFQAVQTQSWNIVYLPYCTGDVHSGNKITVYSDADPAHPRVEYHRGQVNVRGAAQWLRQNLGQPEKLLLTGFSAGGVGSTVTYALMRDTLQPTGKVSLLADSGPLMPAPRSGTPEQYPSLPLHEKIRSAWGLDEPEGLVTQFGGMPGFDVNNLGSVSGALAQRYPQDRFGYMVFQADGNFSAFSYAKFYDDIANAPDARAYRQALYGRWTPDINRWMAELQQYGNVSYHVPFFRNFNQSHCLTIIDFSGTGIEDAGVESLAPFVDNTLDRGPVMRHAEADHVSDFFQPLSTAIRLFKLLTRILG
ncbi:pectin acetylesterase-family hydrolase [Ideonella sp. BN130291]|uniref:pectin acetylesterase-family hydrolase n=1 Tax=Ideonella sp. BN130291 TaxID=3112940 RepID=UPI002E2577DF|nr:pectin acetylesterase-family hydrolase [Ideonella sp. BN130291]